MDIFKISAIILPVVFTMFLGYFSRRRQIVKKDGVEGLKNLVMNFTLPLVIFGAFYKIPFGVNQLILAAVIYGTCIVANLAGRLITRFILPDQKLLPFLTSGFEAGMMGYGLYALLFSTNQISNFAMVDLGQVLFVFTIYMAMLNKKKGLSTKDTIFSMLKSPIFNSAVFGAIFGATGLGLLINHSPAGPAIDAALSYVSAPTGMLMLFVVGYELEMSKKVLKRAFEAAVARFSILFILCAVVLFLLKLIFPVSDFLFWSIILMFLLPAPFVLPLFVDNDEDAGYISTSLSVSTLISILFFSTLVVVKFMYFK